MRATTVRFLSALASGALLLSACQDGRGLGEVAQAASLVGKARAAPSAAPAQLWKERQPGDPLPEGFVPPTSLAPLVRQLKPGVVNVYTTSAPKARPTRQVVPRGDPLEEFFRRFGEGMPTAQTPRRSLGSGFLVNSAGYLITNHHVVDGASEIRVRLADGREFAAKIVGQDSKTDIALLKLEVAAGGAELTDLPTVFLGDSDALEVGDYVIACGNPFGLDHSVSLGIVSAKERVIGAGPYDDFIQTDAAINLGNSGGPLFDGNGAVIGVNTAIVAQGQGIGFAVPINMVKELIPQLLEKGKVVRGWLGVSIQDLTPELAGSLKLADAHGALVAGVMRGSPAEKGGLQAGDVVVAVNGRQVETYNQLSRFVAFVPPGSTAKLTVLRDGKQKNIEVKVGERPDDAQAAAAGPGAPGEVSSDLLGLTVVPIDEARRSRLGIDGGVQIVSIKPDGPAARTEAKPGDVIVELQRQAIKTQADYDAALAKLEPGEMALIRLQRENASIYVAVRLGK